MALLTETQLEYYSGKKSFTGDGTTTQFTVSRSDFAFPGNYSAQNVDVYIDGALYAVTDSTTGNANYTFSLDTQAPTASGYLGWYIEFATAPANNAEIEVDANTDFGKYQYILLDDIINNFMISYVGEGKIISKAQRTDVQFHAMRAIQELSFDTLKSTKSQEIEVPSSLMMILPQDYVNYVKLTWKDGGGIEHIIYPAIKTSNPFNPKQDSDGNYSFDIDSDDVDDTSELIPKANSDTWDSYKNKRNSTTEQESARNVSAATDPDVYFLNEGHRYGLSPQHAQANGSFFIDELKGLIHFSSNMSGKTVTLKYISDGLAMPLIRNKPATSKVPVYNYGEEIKIHKFAEEAVYKWVVYAITSTMIGITENIIQRYKKERRAAIRQAKLRLSNIKLEEITQVLRGKSKIIKH
jgi:hypothetical protein